MKHLCVIPFSGFYESLHDDALDDALDQIFSDRDTGCTVNEDLVMRAWRSMDWKAVHTAYAKAYCENFALEFKLDLTFDEVNSPREYNFTTDRIFAYIPTESLQKVFDTVDTPGLRIKIRENHTSRDGFFSYYDNDLESWGNVLSWDHNQIGTLLQALVEQESVNDWDQFEELSLMDDSNGKGFYDEILFANCPEMARLAKVHEYLETRAKREEVMA